MPRIFRHLLIWIALAAGLAAPAAAQNMFAPVAQVNDGTITTYELQQRQKLLQLFRTPGDLRKQALKGLIDERLQRDAARRAGISVSDQEIADGQTEFAGRANLSREEFLQALAQNGVAAESFRDFVAAGVAWRKLVRERYRGQVQVSEAEVDRAIAATDPAQGVRVLLSELILPANTPQARAETQARAEQLTQIRSTTEFARAARQYSAAPSRERGGRIEWVPLSELPQQLRPLVLALSPGEVTPPVSLPNAIGLFQLRAIEETGAGATTAGTLDYAAFLIPGGRSRAALSQAAQIDARVDTCDDLYGIAKGLPPQRLQRNEASVGQIPSDIALELAKLDENESSTALTRDSGQTLVYLMLCSRSVAPPDTEIDRQAVRNRLVNERVGRLAANYLAELRSNAHIATN